MLGEDGLDKFEVGQKFYRKLVVTADVLEQFGRLSGDVNPLHVDDEYARSRDFKGKVAYGNILGMMLSAFVGMDIGLNEVMLLSERIDFKKPVYVGDDIELCGTVLNKSAAVRVVEFGIQFQNSSGETVASGKCQVRCF